MTMSVEPSRELLVEYLLRLGDDRLILGHRLSEWCGHAPIPEEDIALANIALDCLGHASMLLSEAGSLEGRGRDEDALAYWRDVTEFHNCLLVEQPNQDFACTMVRQYLVDACCDVLYRHLCSSPVASLRHIAEKIHKEIVYHRRHSSEWIVRLGDGTEESHLRTQSALDELWKYTDGLFHDDACEHELTALGAIPSPSVRRLEWMDQVESLLRRATLVIPRPHAHVLFDGRAGKHTEALGHLLAVMQSVPRGFPDAKW